MTKPLYKYLGRADLKDAEHYFTVACAASRKHRDCLNAALKQYGDHGPDVSAVGRDHFPVDVKDELRSLVKEVSVMSDFAHRSRPPRVKVLTISRLGSEVAYRYGCGFYGPYGMAFGPGAK